jgi:hypothetical protein
MKEASYGRVIDNLKQMMYQAPYDESLNNELKTLIVMKLLDQMDKADESYGFDGLINKRLISNREIFINYVRQNNKVPLCPSQYIDKVGLVPTTGFHRGVGEYIAIDVRGRIRSTLNEIEDQLRKKYY